MSKALAVNATVSGRQRFFDFLYKWGMLLTVVLLVAVFGLASDNFLDPFNIINILRSIAIVTVIAIGVSISLTIGGFDLTEEELRAAYGQDTVLTRAHFGRMLFEKGYVSSISEAFDRYLGDRCPCFVPRKKTAPEEAVGLILAAGGIPVLAHPLLYGMGADRLTELTLKLKNAGLKALEALYSTYTARDENQMRRLARQTGLQISGGSDFHGKNKPFIDLGSGRGNLKIPYEILEQLRKNTLERR